MSRARCVSERAGSQTAQRRRRRLRLRRNARVGSGSRTRLAAQERRLPNPTPKENRLTKRAMPSCAGQRRAVPRAHTAGRRRTGRRGACPCAGIRGALSAAPEQRPCWCKPGAVGYADVAARRGSRAMPTAVLLGITACMHDLRAGGEMA
eukprot:355400-Chlamydomonas_euryale.AAC.9